MFALEINFTDGVSQPEMILVRRPQALIGAQDYAHVVIEDMQEIDYQLHIVRDLGRRFRCKPVGVQPNVELPSVLGGVYEGETAIDAGVVKFYVTALDFDLLLKESEPPDRAGMRVLRQVCSSATSPLFPAVVVLGANPMVVSFVPDQPVHIGRSSQCVVRLDSAGISAKHARLGYESGQFWIEDLGSTNGTFVNEQQISGRVNVEPGVPIVLGTDITIIGVMSKDQIDSVSQTINKEEMRPLVQDQSYPILISVSEVARPARVFIPLGVSFEIGRDPGSDVWLGAPHISRRHCAVEMSKTGNLIVRDLSTNGTAYDGGVLRRGDILDTKKEPKVLNFGGGVTVAICFNEEQEQAFINSQGSPHTFLDPEEVSKFEQEMIVHRDPGTQSFDDELNAAVDSARLKGTGQFHRAYHEISRLSASRKILVGLMAAFLLIICIVVVNLLVPVFF